MPPENVTPPAYRRCRWINCPAVYRLGDGRALIIGKRADEIPPSASVGEDEAAIVVDVAMLKGLFDAD